LHAEWDDFLFLYIACDKIFARIEPIVNLMDIEKLHFNIILADIHFLAQLIEEKLSEINKENESPILNMVMAKEKAELPKELALNDKEMDPKKMAILIAQNMLFIAAQIGKMHNFEKAIQTTLENYAFTNSHPEMRFHEIVLKELPTESISQFFYKKYVEMIKEGQYESLMKKRKIGETSSKSEHGGAGSSTP
jgi:hypothetical protein